MHLNYLYQNNFGKIKNWSVAGDFVGERTPEWAAKPKEIFPHSSSLVPARICARAFQENGLFQTAPHVPVRITKYPDQLSYPSNASLTIETLLFTWWTTQISSKRSEVALSKISVNSLFVWNQSEENEKKTQKQKSICHDFFSIFYFYVLVITCVFAQVSLISKRLNFCSEVIWNCNSESQLGTDNESQYKTWSSLK